ncbi:hypothetical protein [Acidimangrovimonas sediminis]|uniref:hypothetical protein n=1 Tax=Acidimangrovimonas sediminis TaxID=2056283 RepID=UPI0011AF7047|nr:hypothetical protein [Acidimangrovimonas sediminis]
MNQITRTWAPHALKRGDRLIARLTVFDFLREDEARAALAKKLVYLVGWRITDGTQIKTIYGLELTQSGKRILRRLTRGGCKKSLYYVVRGVFEEVPHPPDASGMFSASWIRRNFSDANDDDASLQIPQVASGSVFAE